jgi:predicted lysophospholipase L1 biosynthesis ABC-type transport system permease subunit
MKTDSANPQKDLQTIREMMERSSKFLSLSGLSGIFAGVCALAGVSIAWFFLLDMGHAGDRSYLQMLQNLPDSVAKMHIVLDALTVLGLAVLGAVYFSVKKAAKAGLPIWTASTRRIVFHLMIPLATGGMFILIMAYRNYLELVVPAMLIFYGLSLVNAGKFTFGELHYLGLTEIALGILACLFVEQGLLLWAIGFGLMHIVYGTVMYYRHEKE